MFKLHIEGSSLAELKFNLLAAASEFGGAAAPAADKAKPAATAGKVADKPKASELDYKKDVGPLILKLADKSRPAAVKLLSDFGVAKGTELKPDQFAEFITAANAAIEAADELG